MDAVRLKRFVFDTSVLIDYLRGDGMADNALLVAADRGCVFVSLVSLMELWLPLGYPFRIQSREVVKEIIQGLDKGEIIYELEERFSENDYDLPGGCSVEVRDPGQRWRIIEVNQPQFDIRLYNGSLYVSPLHKSSEDVRREVGVLKDLGVHFIPCSSAAQEWALRLLEHHRPLLGRNALTDSLILGTGIARRAWVVTNDMKWFRVDEENQRRGWPFPRLRVISPERLVQEF